MERNVRAMQCRWWPNVYKLEKIVYPSLIILHLRFTPTTLTLYTWQELLNEENSYILRPYALRLPTSRGAFRLQPRLRSPIRIISKHFCLYICVFFGQAQHSECKTIAAVFKKHADYLRIYKPYISDFEKVQKTYDALERNSSSFRRFLKDMESQPVRF